MPLRFLSASIYAVMLTACGTSMKVSDYQNNRPILKLEEYFSGETRAWGLFEDRFGNVRNQFVVDIRGVWDGETLTMEEDFIYSHGATEKRIWRIQKDGETRYTGTAEGVIGIARGEVSGNAFNWTYDFNLNVGDDTWKVHFDDWMFLQDQQTLLNKATVYRWGFKIGTVFLSFHKPAVSEISGVERQAAE